MLYTAPAVRFESQQGLREGIISQRYVLPEGWTEESLEKRVLKFMDNDDVTSFFLTRYCV